MKPQSEMSFLYGNNVAKSGLGRMTEGIPQYAGVVVYSMTDVPLGACVLTFLTFGRLDVNMYEHSVVGWMDAGG